MQSDDRTVRSALVIFIRAKSARWFVLLSITLPMGIANAQTPVQIDPEVVRSSSRQFADHQFIHVPHDPGATFQIDMVLDGRAVTAELVEHSIRGEQFHLFIVDGTGAKREVVPPSARTYRGRFPDGGGEIAASVLADGLHAVILMPGGTFRIVEPSKSHGLAERSGMYNVFRSELRMPDGGRCGVVHAGPQSQHASATPSRAFATVPGTILRAADIAFDADVEFFLANGSSVEATLLDIEAVMNLVAFVYEQQLGITYEITTVVVRTAEPDPYTSTDNAMLLNEMRDEWNISWTDVHRDIAHLMTGKDMDNGVIGFAHIGVMCDVCSGSLGYGYSESRFSPLISERACLTSHELGHNWGADHCNGEADCGIMCNPIRQCPGGCGTFGATAQANIIQGADQADCLSSNAGPIQLPFCETFENGFDASLWSFNALATVTSESFNPPSGQFALRLDSCCTRCMQAAPDEIRSNRLFGDFVSGATLSYQTQQGGGAGTAGSALVVEYAVDDVWTELNTIISDGSSPTSFTAWTHVLPPELTTGGFRIRFRIESVSSADVWYLDDVGITAKSVGDSRLFVMPGVTPAGSSPAWPDAFNDLQDALVAAKCSGGAVQEIWVTEGSYYPDGGMGDRNASFELLDGVSLLGGFVGGELDASQRNTNLHTSFLSGDIGATGIASDNSFHVLRAVGVGPSTLLDGFTIIEGRADATLLDGGGGLFLSSADVTVGNCNFQNNFGNRGGAIFSEFGNPNISIVNFHSNDSFTSGGAVYTRLGAPALNKCSFMGNSATNFGGGVFGSSSALSLRNCVFSGNDAWSGGAIYNQSGIVTVTNCTLGFNTASLSVGGILNANGSATINSSILWGNTDTIFTGELAQVSKSATFLDYCSVEGWSGALGGTGNTGLAPFFVDPDGVDDLLGSPDDNLRLQAASMLLDAGDPLVAAQPGETDRDGTNRVLCARVDVGAYEFGLADYDCDGVVTLTDFAQWPTCATGPTGGAPSPACHAFDCQADFAVDLRDYACLQVRITGWLP